MLIELFSLGIAAEALRAIIGSKSAISLQRGPVDPKFRVAGVTSTSHISSSQKTRINYLSYGLKILTGLSFVLSQSTRLTDRQTDEQMDGRTEFSSQDRVCIPCSAVKTVTTTKRSPVYRANPHVANFWLEPGLG